MFYINVTMEWGRYFQKTSGESNQKKNDYTSINSGSLLSFMPNFRPLHFFHRIDANNAGDWFSCPSSFFPFKTHKTSDIMYASKEDLPKENAIVILGGGGLGTAAFKRQLDFLFQSRRDLIKITWGVGFNSTASTKTLLPSDEIDLYGDYFSNFDIVGTREFKTPQHGYWVPCASCMHPAFDYFASRTKSGGIGVYAHKDRPLKINNTELPYLTNDGNNLFEKLDFLSRFEFVLTNTYHGVYWATLLGAKVICQPFKSSLHSFKHPPVMTTGAVDADTLNSATSYPSSLSECRQVNVNFYHMLTQKFSLL